MERQRPRVSVGGKNRSFIGLVFCLPLLIAVVVLVLRPIASLVRYSFTKYDGISEPTWVGWANYKFLLTWDDFHRIVINNVVLAGGALVWVVVPFLLAIVVFSLRHADLIRSVLFIPAMLSPIIVGGVFRLVLADDGPVNSALKALGLGFMAPGWLSSESFVLVTVILVICWATMGSGVLFYSAGLAAIDPAFFEAARIDGASFRQLVWHIYRPALRPITRFWMLLLIVSTVTGFFPWIYGLTNGGPGVSSTTLDYAVYVTLNQGGQLGRGAAIAVVSVVLVCLILVAQQLARLLRRESDWS